MSNTTTNKAIATATTEKATATAKVIKPEAPKPEKAIKVNLLDYTEKVLTAEGLIIKRVNNDKETTATEKDGKKRILDIYKRDGAIRVYMPKRVYETIPEAVTGKPDNNNQLTGGLFIRELTIVNNGLSHAVYIPAENIEKGIKAICKAIKEAPKEAPKKAEKPKKEATTKEAPKAEKKTAPKASPKASPKKEAPKEASPKADTVTK